MTMGISRSSRPRSEDLNMSSFRKENDLARSHQPPERVWERQVDYAHVGKAPDDELDTVCLSHLFLNIVTDLGSRCTW